MTEKKVPAQAKAPEPPKTMVAQQPIFRGDRYIDEGGSFTADAGEKWDPSVALPAEDHQKRVASERPGEAPTWTQKGYVDAYNRKQGQSA